MLFLLNGGSEASGASVSVKTEGSRFLGDRVSVGKYGGQWCYMLCENGGEIKRSAFLKVEIRRAMLCRNVR